MKKEESFKDDKPIEFFHGNYYYIKNVSKKQYLTTNEIDKKSSPRLVFE
jgi:hypothetical protein